MGNNIIWTCTYCHINPTVQSSRKCPQCGRKLTLWDLSKAPLERKPEWPAASEKRKEDVGEANNCTDYSCFFK